MSNLKYTLFIALLIFFQNPVVSPTGDAGQSWEQVPNIPALTEGFIKWVTSICPIARLLFPKCLNKYIPSKTVTVCKNPSAGDFTSIQAAIDSLPMNNNDRIVINVKAGVYTEQVYISPSKSYITIQGDGADKTTIQWDTSSSNSKSGLFGIPLATMDIQAPYFMAKNITIKNTTPCSKKERSGNGAVALKVSGDAASFLGCNILGEYNTLFDHLGRHYFKDCFIQGALDFIHGAALSMYDHCHLHGLPDVTGDSGLQGIAGLMGGIGNSFVGCKITGAAALYLGMSLTNFAKAVFSHCLFDHVLVPIGWGESILKNIPVVFGTHMCLDGNGTNARMGTGSSGVGTGANAGGSAAGGSATGGSAPGGSAAKGGAAGGNATGGSAAGGSAAGGSAAGGSAAGGSSAGGSARGSSGTSGGGSAAGGGTAGGSGGGSAAGGSAAGGSASGGIGRGSAGVSGGGSAAGGSAAGGSGGGSAAGGSGGGSAAGGSGGGSAGGGGGWGIGGGGGWGSGWGIGGGWGSGGNVGADIGACIAAVTGMPYCKSIELSADQAKPFILPSFIDGDDWVKF